MSNLPPLTDKALTELAQRGGSSEITTNAIPLFGDLERAGLVKLVHNWNAAHSAYPLRALLTEAGAGYVSAAVA